MTFTVAIDGPAAAGKGTIGRALAAEFGFAHLDTGLLYRAVGVLTMNRARGVIDPVSAEMIATRLTEEDLKRDDLRTAVASRAASRVAALSAVRAALLDFQRRFARRPGGAVLDGRDIGTVICPEAEVKLFVTASEEVRARRRYEELLHSRPETRLDAVLNDLRIRDARDAGRQDAPLSQAEDAVLLDTTEMSIDDAVDKARALVRAKLG
ncbi:(d)CMP kinase [Oceanibium sediminis]|uniref:(d)CMP kinase n=1 Tax=Oceanibium sediminis TaxID=2026339 RepID=UPI000DD41AF9|nr:(d)CMP kinase [Oceanibium sediminis]